MCKSTNPTVWMWEKAWNAGSAACARSPTLRSTTWLRTSLVTMASNQHECLHCGKLFKQPSHLQTHLLTHQGTRPHKCTVCKKAFTQTSHLKRHMLQHSDVKPYSCRFCGRGFAYPSELRTHETKHESGHCHVCTQCGMEFPTQRPPQAPPGQPPGPDDLSMHRMSQVLRLP